MNSMVADEISEATAPTPKNANAPVQGSQPSEAPTQP